MELLVWVFTGDSNLNSLCSEAIAFLTNIFEIKTEILISEVEITMILIFFFANAWNILYVIPGVVIIPTPIIETFDTLLSHISFL